MNDRQKFMRKYEAMSQEERLEQMMFEGEPCTWNVFYIEIYNQTASGDRMLQQLFDRGKLK